VLSRYRGDRQPLVRIESESLGEIAGMVAEQQARLDELLQRLERPIAEGPFTDGPAGRYLPATEVAPANGATARLVAPPLSLTKLPHVLRTPLHGILGHVQNLRRDSTTSPAHSDALAAIENNGRQLLDLLNDLVDLSRLEAGECQLASQPLSLQQVVEDALADIAHFAAERSVALHPKLPSPLPWTQGDGARLRRLLARLLRSALGSQATAPGDRALRLDIRHDNDRLTIALIGQHGAGSAATGGSPEAGSAALTETDLDYLVGSRLVALFGGDVLRDVTSGAFSARLPFASRVPQDALPKHLRGLPAHIHCRLMVVEPRPEIEPVCEALLAGPTCTIEAASDLASARRRLQSDPFDLVLLGIEGAPKKAEDAAAELRLVAAGDPAVITVRQVNTNSRWSVADNTGFDAVLDKPIDPEALLTTLGELLGKSLAGQAVAADPERPTAWPQPLGRDTAVLIDAAVDLGDIESLQGLCEELSQSADAPGRDVAALQLAVRHFDLDALRRLAVQCAAVSPDSSNDA
jgi:CheY-like chemotaxis protein